MRLAGKVALISGGARGMGAEEAKLFAREGAKVVMGDILDAEGRGVEAQINESGGEAIFVHLDVTSEEGWAKAVQAAVQRFGKLDVLVNNAGISGRGAGDGSAKERWERVMDINSTGVFLGTKQVIPEMKKAGGGSIINISSIYGLVGSSGYSRADGTELEVEDQAGSSAYHASKGGGPPADRVDSPVRNGLQPGQATAIQHAQDGIRCDSVHPGFIETSITEVAFSGTAMRRDTESKTPMGRLGAPLDIAYGVLFLASDESSYMTGSELVIDGGWTAQ